MPFVSGNAFFFPALVILGVVLLMKGGRRGLVCILMLALIVSAGDGLVCRTIKHAVGRQRPFAALTEVRQPGSKPSPTVPSATVQVESRGTAPAPDSMARPGSGSMPSSHAANWFAATMVALIYFRRSVWAMLPLAVLVSFSRVYNGVHYPR